MPKQETGDPREPMPEVQPEEWGAVPGSRSPALEEQLGSLGRAHRPSWRAAAVG